MADAPAVSKPIGQLLVPLAAFVVLTAGMSVSAEVLNPIFLALFLSIVCSKPVKWLERRRFPRWLAVTVVLLSVLILMLAIAGATLASLAQLYQKLPIYKEALAEHWINLSAWLRSLGFNFDEPSLTELFNGERAMKFLTAFLTGLLNSFSNIGTVLLIFVFMLADFSGMGEKLRNEFGETSGAVHQCREFARSVGSYLSIQGMLGTFAGLLDYALLSILRVDFALLWGVLSVLLSFVPNLGFVIALVPPVLLALLVHGPLTALAVIVGYIVINGAVDNILGPRFLSEGLNVTPLVTILSIVYWTFVLGPIGAIIALPMTLMFKKLILDQYDDTRWVSAMMSLKPVRRKKKVREPVPP